MLEHELSNQTVWVCVQLCPYALLMTLGNALNLSGSLLKHEDIAAYITKLGCGSCDIMHLQHGLHCLAHTFAGVFLGLRCLHPVGGLCIMKEGRSNVGRPAWFHTVPSKWWRGSQPLTLLMCFNSHFLRTSVDLTIILIGHRGLECHLGIRVRFSYGEHLPQNPLSLSAHILHSK